MSLEEFTGTRTSHTVPQCSRLSDSCHSPRGVFSVCLRLPLEQQVLLRHTGTQELLCLQKCTNKRSVELNFPCLPHLLLDSVSNRQPLNNRSIFSLSLSHCVFVWASVCALARATKPFLLATKSRQQRLKWQLYSSHQPPVYPPPSPQVCWPPACRLCVCGGRGEVEETAGHSLGGLWPWLSVCLSLWPSLQYSPVPSPDINLLCLLLNVRALPLWI